MVVVNSVDDLAIAFKETLHFVAVLLRRASVCAFRLAEPIVCAGSVNSGRSNSDNSLCACGTSISFVIADVVALLLFLHLLVSCLRLLHVYF